MPDEQLHQNGLHPESHGGGVAALKLLVKGFTPVERRLLEATVKLSQRRTPPIALLDEADGERADVVMVDTRDAEAMSWSVRQTWLRPKTVIWVDAATVPSGHTLVKRPVQWPILPMLLARALENTSKVAQQVAAAAAAAAPAARADAHAPRGAAAAPAAAVKRRVLVVDDSLAMRLHVRSLLEARGIEVVEADSGEAGIAAASEAYPCILMDVLMPGMDGYEACRRIRARIRGNNAPAIVMLTSRSSPFDHIRGKMAGCAAYLTKPVNPEQLYDVLKRYLSV